MNVRRVGLLAKLVKQEAEFRETVEAQKAQMEQVSVENLAWY